MSQAAIRASLETRLKTLQPTFPTVYENMPYRPLVGVAYQQVHVLFATPDNPEMGAGYREQGYMQVSLMYPQGTGPKDAAVKAKAIRDLFPRGLSLTTAGVTLTVTRTPAILPGVVDGDRWRVPVRIDWHSNFLN